MKMVWCVIGMAVLGGCVYEESPYGRVAVVDWPVQRQTTVNKNITVHAPAGSTVIYQEAQPLPARYPQRYIGD